MKTNNRYGVRLVLHEFVILSKFIRVLEMVQSDQNMHRKYNVERTQNIIHLWLTKF